MEQWKINQCKSMGLKGQDNGRYIDILYIPNVKAQSYPFHRLQLVVETFGHST